MSNDNREERERLKEEYKEHYRKIREVKERLSRTQKTKNISEALRSMDTSQLMNSFDDFLYNVKNKLAHVEARLDVAMDSLAEEDEPGGVSEAERDEELQKAQAKETLKQVKLEMGLLYSEIERQADVIRVEKTIGLKAEDEEPAAPLPEQREEDSEEDSTEGEGA